MLVVTNVDINNRGSCGVGRICGNCVLSLQLKKNSNSENLLKKRKEKKPPLSLPHRNLRNEVCISPTCMPCSNMVKFHILRDRGKKRTLGEAQRQLGFRDMMCADTPHQNKPAHR